MSEDKKKSEEVFCFSTQLEVGAKGERVLLERYPRKLELINEHYSDFRVKSSGEILELKTDTYDMGKTSNFFIERYSDVIKKSPGGPWQARKKGAGIFCYMFINNNCWFEFRDLPALIKRLEELTRGKGLVYIRNKAWTTGGYKIKRADLEDLYKVYEW